MRYLSLILGIALAMPISATQSARPGAGIGIRDVTPSLTAYTHATIVTAPGQVIEDGTLIVEDGVILRVSSGGGVPDGAREVDLSGRTLYPGFIELVSSVGMPEAAVELSGPRHPYSSMVRAERAAATDFTVDTEANSALRGMGFTAALTTHPDAMFRGSGAVVSLGDGEAGDHIVSPRAGQHLTFTFNVPNWVDPPVYPASVMGAIALMRQTFSDASWYQEANAYWERERDGERPQYNPSLEALADAAARRERVFMAAEDELDLRRALAIRDEFDLDLVLVGTGYEYRVATDLSGETLVLPLGFPAAPAVEDPDGVLDVSLEQLSHWEQAPGNAAEMVAAGARIAITSQGSDGFWGELRAAVAAGLDQEAALAALTTHPAYVAGVTDRLGTLEAGKLAHFVIADGDLFDDGAIQGVVVDGVLYEDTAWPQDEPLGSWAVSYQGTDGPASFEIAGGPGRYTLDAGGAAAIAVAGDALDLFIAAERFGREEGHARLAATLTGERLVGTGELPDGTRFSFLADRTAMPEAEDAAGDGDEAAAEAEAPPARLAVYPAGAYAQDGLPERPPAVLIQGATIWTSAEEGILEGADLLVRGSEIAAIGQDLDAPRGALVIDGSGLHVTPGLIDAHSHTAMSGGSNECSDSVTVEVRAADTIDPTDVSIYRQLAGGLTAANIMHGSCNSMGGQVQTVKLRWGADAATLILDDAQRAVKFALGENVKRSAWDTDTTRYPQTRMGVMEIMADTFAAAREYGDALERRGGPPVRRDLRLEAALEILEGEREIHIHSYRQDEILAFVRLAEEHGLEVAAFQHVLEGYKVADEIAELGAGASTFADWWAYKYEVVDAIPYNGAIMYRQGVSVTFNSDSSELARRMNTEAAKAVRYGGVPRADALAMVTINAAEQLGIDHRTGSLEEGKDADFVIWSADPLSVYAMAMQTWVDGRRYFDRETDRRMRETTASERARLIAAALPDRLAERSIELPSPEDEEEGDDRVFACGDYERGLYGDGRDTHECALEVIR